MSLGVNLRSLLREAIASRRREVEAILREDARGPDAGMPIEARAAAGTAAVDRMDDEEALRRFMVNVWPAAGRATADDGAVAAFFDLLARLDAPAWGDDLRFLDAWNNAFELMLTWPGPLRAREDVRAALRSYARLLDHHAASLGGES